MEAREIKITCSFYSLALLPEPVHRMVGTAWKTNNPTFPSCMRKGTSNARCVSEALCLLEEMRLTHHPMCWDVPSPNPALQSWPSFKFGLMGRAPHLTSPFSAPQKFPEMNSVLTLMQEKSLCLERPFYICSTEEEHMLILAMADPLDPHL